MQVDQYFFIMGSYGGTALVTGTIRLGQKSKESVDGRDRARQHLGPQPKRRFFYRGTVNNQHPILSKRFWSDQ